MKICMVGSGSGGHIYPAIALYQYLKKQNITVQMLAFKTIDKEIYKQNKIPFLFFDSHLSSYQKIRKISKFLKEEKMDKVISFGGKNGFLTGICAKLRGISLYLCEQNIVFGKANFVLRFFSKKVFLSMPIKENQKYILTGNPVVDRIKTTKKKNFFANGKPVVACVCGSLGSDTILSFFRDYIKENNETNYIIIKGKNASIEIEEKENVKVFSYYEPLTEIISSSDLLISRAGATTIAEMIALQKPAILIPSPYVPNHHQLKNAKYLYQNNACVLIEEDKLKPENVKKAIQKILFSPFENYRMKNAILKLQYKNPCQKIYEELK